MEDNKLCLEKQPLSDELLNKMNAYWRAANYLSAGQLYLLDNPLLKKPLTMDQIKKKIVGHWGTVPGQNFIYVHCNRVIKRYDLDMILLSGPGHGGNFLIANTYLEGSYSEVYPNISQDEEGMKKMFKQFSFPCGVPSHCAPEHQVLSMRVENLDIQLLTALVLFWTTQILSLQLLSVTVKLKQGRLLLHGSPTNS